MEVAGRLRSSCVKRDHIRLPRLHACLVQVEAREGRGQAADGEEPSCSSTGTAGQLTLDQLMGVSAATELMVIPPSLQSSRRLQQVVYDAGEQRTGSFDFGTPKWIQLHSARSALTGLTCAARREGR
jgi:hypothetical protein